MPMSQRIFYFTKQFFAYVKIFTRNTYNEFIVKLPLNYVAYQFIFSTQVMVRTHFFKNHSDKRIVFKPSHHMITHLIQYLICSLNPGSSDQYDRLDMPRSREHIERKCFVGGKAVVAQITYVAGEGVGSAGDVHDIFCAA